MDLRRLPSERLREAHSELSHVFDHLVRVAEVGDAGARREAWEVFRRGVEAHLTFEELQLFPALSGEGPHGASQVRRLAADHATIRRDMVEVGIALDLPARWSAAVERFIGGMHLHAAREETWLHPAADRLMAARHASTAARAGEDETLRQDELEAVLGGPLRRTAEQV